ncbi:MAG TPA: GNAT family N-acyltransferase, partial [Bacteroidales bacterium]|nr:GNAT family N-acyltransferase [Bacteroidales bacterium]
KIPSELLNKQHETISLHIGSAISVKDQLEFSDTSSFAPYLRARVYALSNKTNSPQAAIPQPFVYVKPIAKPAKQISLLLEITNINAYYQLFRWQQYAVYCAPSSVIPKITAEIGRLREITFREAGEGTNEARDIDEFDKYYHQLFIWDSDAEKIVGGYRIGKGKEILKHYGINGFYTQTLFRMNKEMTSFLDESMELGRSFIIKEYQRKPLSLFLLWKGILHLLWKHPEYKNLMGPVSISNTYSRLSQELIVKYIRQNHFDNVLAMNLRPKHPFAEKPSLVNTDILVKHTGDLQGLDRLIKDIDPTNDRIPVLLRKYLELGGKIASFNIDPKFNHVVDGFLVLDIKNVKQEMIKALAGKKDEVTL